jgi:hypothetical protein
MLFWRKIKSSLLRNSVTIQWAEIFPLALLNARSLPNIQMVIILIPASQKLVFFGNRQDKVAQGKVSF